VEALKHPGVQKLLQTLREQPQQGHIAMQAVSRDPELARRVKVQGMLAGRGIVIARKPEHRRSSSSRRRSLLLCFS
jgi:hypothetical protein